MTWIVCVVLLLGAASLIPHLEARPTLKSSERSAYVVMLDSAPSVVEKARSAPSLFPRVAGASHKLDFHSPASLSHAAALTRGHVSTLLRAGIMAERMIYRHFFGKNLLYAYTRATGSSDQSRGPCLQLARPHNGVKLPTGKAYSARGYSPNTKLLPLMYSADAAHAAQSEDISAETYFCLLGSLNASLVKGKIAICSLDTGYEQSDEARRAGGLGITLTNHEDLFDRVDTEPGALSLPAARVTYSDGRAIIKYATTAESPRASFTRLTANFGLRALAVADFSTRRPVKNDVSNVFNYVLKPDVAGPGVSIWAAWTGHEKLNGRPLTSSMESGTSMAAAHLAGVAALIKQRHPGWSTFAIKSAMLTTASMLDNKKLPIQGFLNPATPFDIGSSQINPARVLDPGLVYNSSTSEMLAFLLGVNRDLTGNYFVVSAGLKAVKPTELNVPNIAAPGLNRALTFRRVVKSVATRRSTYQAIVIAPAGASVKVVPSRFTISPGQLVTFRVVLTARSANRLWSFGSLTWQDGTHSVRSVLAVAPVER
eukprot:jgi/Mesen1/10953/ME000096S10528